MRWKGIKMDISKNLIDRVIDENVMIINLNSGSATVLDEIGVIFWEAIKSKTNVEDLVSKVIESYDVDESTVKSDYERFICQLVELNILIDENLKI